MDQIISFTIPFAPSLVKAAVSVIGFALVRTFVKFWRG